MKRVSTIFLQIAILLFGAGVLAFLLAEPQFEGRNVHATQFQIYFNDPFLAYLYVAFIPFFVGLYQGFKLLGHARRDEIFTPAAVRAVRIIKYCAVIVAIFILGAEGYIFVFVRGTDDVAGGVMMGFFVMVMCAIVATAATVFERVLQNAVDLKTENDLTV